MIVSAIIERNKNGFYSVYVEDQLPGIGLNGQGYSVEEAISEMMKALDNYMTIFREKGIEIPAELINLKFDYKYDMQSFFNYFSWINISKLATKIGVNSSLLRQYKQGIAFASEKQCKKIQDGLRELGQDLTRVRF